MVFSDFKNNTSRIKGALLSHHQPPRCLVTKFSFWIIIQRLLECAAFYKRLEDRAAWKEGTMQPVADASSGHSTCASTNQVEISYRHQGHKEGEEQYNYTTLLVCGNENMQMDSAA